VIALESLTSCFQGIIPSWLCTCSAAGEPNCAIISNVEYVDPTHVALSFQFFNKSKRNISENPHAMVRILDPDTLKAYRLTLRYERTETAGPVFDSMRLRIEAIASYSGLKGIFKLLGADIYAVEAIEHIPYEIGIARESQADGAAGLTFTMKALQEFGASIHDAATLDCMLESILATLECVFGFRHSMILLASETPERLELIASRGYPEGGVGSEVTYGEGIIGMVAEARKPIRITGMMRQMLYAAAVRRRAEEHGLCPDDRRIALPGLPGPEFQIGIPLLARGELVGVLCIETDQPYRFFEEDRAYLEVLGGYMAIAIQNALLLERSDESDAPAPDAAVVPAAPAAAATRARIQVEWFASDEVLLVDGEYLVRGVPARILRKLLREHAESRGEFTNRRLRLDRALQLPELKDNLESRLILLRHRLEERCPEIRLVPSGRGRFRLELTGEVALAERS